MRESLLLKLILTNAHPPLFEKPSRRSFLKSAVALTAAATFPASFPLLANSRAPLMAFVGTYTDHGEGIYLFQMDPATGALTRLKVFTGISNPSWLAMDPGKSFLYAVNEDSPGTVSAFRVAASTRDLTQLNTVSSGGSTPAHLSVHPSGRYVFVANYGSGNVAVLRISPSGSLLPANVIQNDINACMPGPCIVGPTHAVSAPQGSRAISGHDAPHAHMIQSDPGGKYVLVNDLGLDRTIVWKFDAGGGALSDPKTVASSAGAGPRHFAFHPNGRWLYSLNEEASTIAFMTYDAPSGNLILVTETPTLPSGFVGSNFASEVLVSPNGRFVYAANRLHDSIAIFSVGASGTPTLIGEEWTRADYPRSFTIDPTGTFLYSCNHRGDNITVFRLDDGGFRIKFTGQCVPVGSPAHMIFL
jgi:6-phosphogluconolactonase (cycloisomerase 2 family)